MNKQKQIETENNITKVIYTIIKKYGYFNVDFDLKEIIKQVHFYYPNVSTHYIRKCFFKNVYSDKNFINQYDY